MKLFNDIRKLAIFCTSFLGLFFISKFVLIETGISSLLTSIGQKSLELKYGRSGLLVDQEGVSLFWGSVDNENFQDIYFRLKYLVENNVSLKNVSIHLNSELFAQKVFDGTSLDRVIPYYPSTEIFDRVLETGVSYELIINFLKYKLGVPFRLTREMSLLIDSKIGKTPSLPYFSPKVFNNKKAVNYQFNIQYFWMTLELIVQNKIPLTVILAKSNSFPNEINVNDLLVKADKLFQGKIKFIEN